MTDKDSDADSQNNRDSDADSQNNRDSDADSQNNRDSDADSQADETTLTHVDETGATQMVDVGEKRDSKRRAVARGTVHLQPTTVDAIRDNEIAKGDVLATARVGAIQAVKHTWETIPLCHQIPITNVEINFTLDTDSVTLTVGVETVGKTGCEMEALEGTTTGLNVIWDMVKAAEKDDGGYPETRIENVHVVEKTVTELPTE